MSPSLGCVRDLSNDALSVRFVSRDGLGNFVASGHVAGSLRCDPLRRVPESRDPWALTSGFGLRWFRRSR